MNKNEQKNYLLFNALFRHQVYFEGVKAYFVRSYLEVLKRVAKTVSANIGLIQYSTMDQLSRRELAKLVSSINKEQEQIYNEYSDELLADLRDFVDIDSEITEKIYNSIIGKTESIDRDKVWNDAVNEPIPANGLFLEDALTAFSAAAMSAVISSIQRSYANGLTPSESIKELVGSSSNRFTDGILVKLLNQHKSLLNTSLQHISSITQASAATQFVDEYVWVSILDNKTTVICWSRNGTVYKYGEGPLPPAHNNCRSKAVPITGESAFAIPETYYNWLKEQPEDFLKDVLGESMANQLIDNQLKASDFTSISTIKPLSLNQFAQKVKYIIGG
jgi:SPP1 gp7 family putative phage head morphogenesis protein